MEGFCLIGHAGLFKTTAENLHIVGIERPRVFLYLPEVRIDTPLAYLMADHGLAEAAGVVMPIVCGRWWLTVDDAFQALPPLLDARCGV